MSAKPIEEQTPAELAQTYREELAGFRTRRRPALAAAEDARQRAEVAAATDPEIQAAIVEVQNGIADHNNTGSDVQLNAAVAAMKAARLANPTVAAFDAAAAQHRATCRLGPSETRLRATVARIKALGLGDAILESRREGGL